MKFFTIILFLFGIISPIISSSISWENESLKSENSDDDSNSILNESIDKYLCLMLRNHVNNPPSYALDCPKKGCDYEALNSAQLLKEHEKLAEEPGTHTISCASPECSEVFYCRDSDSLESRNEDIPDDFSYCSYADSDEEFVFEEHSVPGQWTRKSAYHVDVGASEDLYYHVYIALTFGFSKEHPAYNYAKTFLKACKILEARPDAVAIMFDRRLSFHFSKFGIDTADEEFGEFLNVLGQTVLPDTSILSCGPSNFSEEYRWVMKRDIIIRFACEEIKRIMSNFDVNQFKEIISQDRSIPETALNEIIALLCDNISFFVSSCEEEIVHECFITALFSEIHLAMEAVCKRNGIEDESLVEQIKFEIGLVISSPIHLVVNYASAACITMYPDIRFPIFN